MVAAAVIAFKFDHAREFTSSHASEPLPQKVWSALASCPATDVRYLKAYGVMLMNMANIKDEAKRLIERLHENVTYDDLMHEIYVH